MDLDQVTISMRGRMILSTTGILYSTLATPKDDHKLLSILTAGQAHMMMVASLAMTLSRMYLAPNVSKKYLTALDQVTINMRKLITLSITEIPHSTLATVKDDHQL